MNPMIYLTNTKTPFTFHTETVVRVCQLFLGEDMNKTELINALSEETNFSKKDVAKVLSSFTRIIERTLKKGGRVSLTGFGTYWISKRPARTGINPATKERIQLPAISVPRFKPGKHLKEQVRAA